jgi:hypothetical protein
MENGLMGETLSRRQSSCNRYADPNTGTVFDASDETLLAQGANIF